MIWISIASLVVASALIRLGALAVWVLVLKAMLLVAAITASLFGVGLAYQMRRNAHR